MDQDSLEVVAGRLSDRLQQIETVLPRVSRRRGAALFQLVRGITIGITSELATIKSDFIAASDDERNVLGRKAHRLLQLSEILGQLTPFVRDVERQDVPLGLLQMIDVLVESLLPGGADPVVHSDTRFMYSTMDLVQAVQPVLAALTVSQQLVSRPVVFFLPAGDPSNALLMPILAHEVGHAAVERDNLGSEVLRSVDADRLNALFTMCLGRAPGTTNGGRWQLDLFHWLDEFLCDALATALCGPSLLFAAAAFFPASDPGTLTSHPFPADRLKLCLEQLSELGWDDILSAQCPRTVAWLAARETPTPTGDPREDFLRGAVNIIREPLGRIARAHVPNPLLPAEFVAASGDLCKLISAGIPPAQLGVRPADPWSITLAGWFEQFNSRGDRPGTLAVAVADREFNEFLQKSIELARIARLWSE